MGIENHNVHVEISDLNFRRGHRTIFKRVNMRIQRGKITAIMGPSGCGKTTLLRLIGGQLQPRGGAVSVNGDVVHKMSHRALFEARTKMGLLFQSGALFTNLSVYDNVAFPLREHTNLSDAMIHHIVLMKLEAVGLRGARHLMPSELSGGMGRRVALARAIALDPELIMYDEPFAGQDPISMGVIAALVEKLNHSIGLTTVIVSHDVAETLSLADYVYVIADGEVIGEGTPAELQALDSPRVQQFLNGLPDGVVPFHYPAQDYQEDLLGVKD